METISSQKNNPYLDASANKQGPQTCRFHWQVGQTPGELKKALDILAKHGLSLSNIESQVWWNSAAASFFTFNLCKLVAHGGPGNISHFCGCYRGAQLAARWRCDRRIEEERN